MKLTALMIALAMLCMIIEGCDRTPVAETYGQKIDRGLAKSNGAIIDVGDTARRPAQELRLAPRAAASRPDGAASG